MRSIMSLTVEVGLLSGRMVALAAGPDESVEVLTRRAETMLAVSRGRLLNSSGSVLDGAATLQQCGLRNGDALTLQIGSVYVRGNDSAFAAILSDGTVTW